VKNFSRFNFNFAAFIVKFSSSLAIYETVYRKIEIFTRKIRARDHFRRGSERKIIG